MSRTSVMDGLKGKAPKGLTTAEIPPHEFRKRYNPNPLGDWEGSWQYILPSIASGLGAKPSQEDVNEVKRLQIAYLEKVNQENPERLERALAAVESGWPDVEKILRRNKGLTKMMINHGAYSEYMWNIIQMGMQAKLLELFHGRAIPIGGNRFENYRYDDSISLWSVFLTPAVNVQERTIHEQMYLKKKRGMNVLLCGAGLVPTMRVYDFPGKEIGHKVLAVDADPRNQKNLSLVFDGPIKEYGITYELSDVRDICNDRSYAGKFDIVSADGFMVYYRMPGQTEEILRVITKPLDHGGLLIFDVPVFQADLLCCSKTIGWQPDGHRGWASQMLPEISTTSAIRRFRKILVERMGYHLQYKVVDFRGRCQTVMFVATKP